MKKFFLILLFLLSVVSGWAQRLDNIAIQASGKPVPNATVAVCTQPAVTSTQPCSPLATLYTSATFGTSTSNPLTADSNGNYHFYAKPALGPYTVQIYGTGIATPYVMKDQYIPIQSFPTYQSVSFSATPTFDASPGPQIFTMTLTGNVTSSTLSGGVAGQFGEFTICQDATGNRTFAWPTNVIAPPAINPAPGVCTSASVTFNGTNWYVLGQGPLYVPGSYQTFNVKDYGATGNATGTGDTTGYNNAATACQNNGGGTVFFPPGQYILTAPNALNPGVFSGTDYSVCSLVGAGATNTRITLQTQGITLSNQLIASPYYAGDVSGIQFEGGSLTSGKYCLRVLDSVGWNIHNNAFNNVTPTAGVMALLFEINNKWCERNQVWANQFWSFSPTVKILFDTGTAGDFAYNAFFNNHFQVPDVVGGTDIFFSTGTSGGGVIGNRFEGAANFVNASGHAANWFHVTGTGNQVGNNWFNLRDEDDNGGVASTAYFCIDSGVTIPAGSGLSGYVMSETGSLIGCSGTQAMSVNLDVWGRGLYAGINGISIGSTLNSTMGTPTPSASWTFGAIDPTGACTTGNLYTNTAGASTHVFWVCVASSWVDIK